jgi:cytochrome c oxidase cbb3-type subunit 3
VDKKHDELLDHEADGIREFDNALPRWWLYGFYFTMLFAAAYLVNYHLLATPLVGKKGMVAEYEADVLAAGSGHAPRAAGTGAGPAAPLIDADSLAKGRAIFESSRNACFTCHRPDLGGLVGPNLTDDHWRHGCSLHDVMTDIRTGFPAMGMMPFGIGQPLTDDQLLQLASYVLSKRGTSPPNPKPLEADRDKPCPATGT